MRDGTAHETQRVLRLYEKEAHKYDRQMRFFDRLLFAGGRAWVCEQAVGEVLEIGVGTGRNLLHYGEGVQLTGIELSPAMLEVARARACELGRKADLRVGDAQALEFGDRSFDTVVCTLSLCTIPDDRAAVAEVRRVLRPGGRFLMLEHVRSPLLPVRLAQRLLDPLAVRFEADHLLREPLEHLRAEGFEVESLERSKLGIVERVAARKPPVPARTRSPPPVGRSRPFSSMSTGRSATSSLSATFATNGWPVRLRPACAGVALGAVSSSANCSPSVSTGRRASATYRRGRR